MIKFRITMLLLVSILMAASNHLFAQNNKYSIIRIQLSDQIDLHDLQVLDLDIDHIHMDDLQRIEFFATPPELQRLDDSQITYEILIADYSEFYAAKREEELSKIERTSTLRNPANHFGYGSMGGFYTLSEIESKLDEMSTDFPAITTSKFSIGTSVEGRTIWAMKISDNPNVNEDEAVVYYDAIHHAREPLSMAVCINYMFWLLENYATDPNVQYIVDNRELYFVPCVNPDGYEYNRQTNPGGGGLWRKNRRDNGNGCFGVDLNRNYSFEFGHDGSCASSNTCSSTYKGPSAFSEPETQATRDFIDSIQPSTAFSIHSTAGSYLMPYGYNASPPAFDIYSEWASDFLSENDHPYGVTYQMLGYTSCGTTRDYLHSENIYGWTPEIDGSGFWPDQSEIFSLVDENVYPLFYQAWIAGSFANFQSHTASGFVVPDSSVYIGVEIKNKAVSDTATNVVVTLECLDPNVTISGSGTLVNIPPRERKTSNLFLLEIGSAFEASSITIDIIVSQDGVETDRESIVILAGEQSLLFSDDAESGSGNWATAGNGINWGINGDDSYGGNNSFGDSDNGNSQNNTLNYFTLNNTIDLSTSLSPQLEFFSKWSLEAGDFILVQASIDGGTNWSTLRTFINSESWHQELISLENYKMANFKIRFVLDTDGSIPGDGFYFDDISIKDYNCPDCPICLLSVASFPYGESFESGLGDWAQGSDDDLNWTINTNGTPSADTGPSAASDGSYYLYIEASDPNFPSKTASLESPCLDFTDMGTAELSFQYHMYGTANNMNLDVQASVDAGQTWSPSLWSRTGNQGNQWLEGIVNLDTFTGEYVVLRFFGTTGETWQGDIAIDDIGILACPMELNVNQSLIADGIYRASYLIYTNKTVPSNGDVIFRSGAEIDLNPDFETQLGGQFEALISDCLD